MHFVTRRLVALVLVGATAVLSSAAPVAAQTSGWQPGPGAILDNTYDGVIDVPSNGATVPGGGSFTVSGWFVDRQAEGWAGADDIQVWRGAMDGGGQMLARGSIGQNRPDVATALGNPFWAASGFSAAVPGSAVPAGPQTLSVYVHTGGKGWWFKQVNVNGGGSGTGTAAPAPSGTATGGPPQLTVSDPTAGQNVSTRSKFTIQGTAIDPGFGGSGIDRVEVWLNGERDGQGGTSLGTTTPDSSGAWSLEFTPTNFPSTHSNLYIYAHSKNTGLETEITRDFNITDK
jgi:hypothetical protein